MTVTVVEPVETLVSVAVVVEVGTVCSVPPVTVSVVVAVEVAVDVVVSITLAGISTA